MVTVLVTYKGDWDEPTEHVGVYQLQSEVEVEELQRRLSGGFCVGRVQPIEGLTLSQVIEDANYQQESIHRG